MIFRLAQSEHFDVEWWSGVDSGGLFLLRRQLPTQDLWQSYRARPHCYLALQFIPNLISELRQADEHVTLLSRVTHDFIPTSHRRPKKDGGDPAKAYYVPLTVEGEERQELANLIEFACSQENIAREEDGNPHEGYSVLISDYLENGAWASPWYNQATQCIELQPVSLKQEPKARFLPWAIRYGVGSAVLRMAKKKYKCSRAGMHRGSQGCIDYVWINPNELYVEHKQGNDLDRYHLKCAFCHGLILDNWLSPHFEQYYTLTECGLKNWIDKEREKRSINDDPEHLQIPSVVERVTAFVEMLQKGYELDEYERRDWREHLRECPMDIEPYQTARQIMGLSTIPMITVQGSHL